MTDLIERFAQYLQFERHASPHTIRNYRSDLEQFHSFLKGRESDAAMDIHSVDALRIRGYLSFLFSKEKKKSSIGRKLAAIRAFFKFLGREHLLSQIPPPRCQRPSSTKPFPAS